MKKRTIFNSTLEVNNTCIKWMHCMLHAATLQQFDIYKAKKDKYKKFKLRVSLDNNIEADVHEDMNEAIKLALENKVKELDIDLVGRNRHPNVCYSCHYQYYLLNQSEF